MPQSNDYVYAIEFEIDGTSYAVVAWGGDGIRYPDNWEVHRISGRFDDFVGKKAMMRNLADYCAYKGYSSNPFIPYPWPPSKIKDAEAKAIRFSVESD